MKKLLYISIFFITVMNSYSQTDKSIEQGLEYLNQKNYLAAYNIFDLVLNNHDYYPQNREDAHYYASECLFKSGSFQGAIIKYESFLDEYPHSNYKQEVLYNLGTLYFQNGEYRKTRERLNSLIQNYPVSDYLGSSYYWIAKSYASENKFIEAEENFNLAISYRESNLFIQHSIYSLAQLYENQGDYKNAITNYDELLAYYKNHELAPKAQLRIGICYFKIEEYDSAVLELTDPIINDLTGSELIEAKYYLSNSFVKLNDFKNALLILDELSNDDLDISLKNKITFSKAWVKFRMADYESSFELFDELSQLHDDSLSINALFWSAESKRYSGNMDEANKIYKIFLEKYPNHYLASRAQLGKGTLLYNQSQDPEAEKSLLNAVLSNDYFTKGRAYTLLGEIKLNKKLYEEAESYFNQARKYADRFPEIKNRSLLGLGVSQYYLNKYDNAIENLEELKSASPDFETAKVLFYLAESYFSRGEYSAALKNYNQINSNDESIKKQTIFGKGYTYFNLKDFSNSIFYLNEFCNKYKSDYRYNDARLRLADSYFGIKNFEKASFIYKELFSKRSSIIDNDLAYYQYCQSLFKAGKANEAINEFVLLQKKFPKSKYADASQYVVGWIYFQQSNFKSAIDNYLGLISKYPNSTLIPTAYYSIGDSYFNLGNYDSSIVYYNKILESYPNTNYILDAVNGIQYAYIAKEQPDNAVSFIDQFINENPSSKFNDQIFIKKGDIYYSSENYEDAIESYRQFILRFPSSKLVPTAYYWIGKSAAILKRDSEAIENFNHVIDRAIKSEIGISSSIELANLYNSKKQFTNAVSILDKTITAQPTSNRIPELLFMKSKTLISDNNVNDAYTTLEQIITYYEGTVFAAKSKLELAKLESSRKNYENALMLLQEIAEKRLDDIGAEAQYVIGLIYFDQNKYDEAITAFVRVRSVYSAYDEWFTQSLLKLGDCYLKLKDKKQARDMYRAVLNRHNTGVFAKEAKRKLNQL